MCPFSAFRFFDILIPLNRRIIFRLICHNSNKMFSVKNQSKLKNIVRTSLEIKLKNKFIKYLHSGADPGTRRLLHSFLGFSVVVVVGAWVVVVVVVGSGVVVVGSSVVVVGSSVVVWASVVVVGSSVVVVGASVVVVVVVGASVVVVVVGGAVVCGSNGTGPPWLALLPGGWGAWRLTANKNNSKYSYVQVVKLTLVKF